MSVKQFTDKELQTHLEMFQERCNTDTSYIPYNNKNKTTFESLALKHPYLLDWQQTIAIEVGKNYGWIYALAILDILHDKTIPVYERNGGIREKAYKLFNTILKKNMNVIDSSASIEYLFDITV